MVKKGKEPEKKSKLAAAPKKTLAKKATRQQLRARSSSPQLSSDTDSERPASAEEPESSLSPTGKAYDPAEDTTDSSDDFAGLEEEGGEDERPRKKRKSNTGGKLSAIYGLLKDNNKHLKVPRLPQNGLHGNKTKQQREEELDDLYMDYSVRRPHATWLKKIAMEYGIPVPPSWRKAKVIAAILQKEGYQ
eukprot:1139302-Pelagomonas_calceolata.AAC.3